MTVNKTAAVINRKRCRNAWVMRAYTFFHLFCLPKPRRSSGSTSAVRFFLLIHHSKRLHHDGTRGNMMTLSYIGTVFAVQTIVHLQTKNLIDAYLIYSVSTSPRLWCLSPQIHFQLKRCVSGRSWPSLSQPWP